MFMTDFIEKVKQSTISKIKKLNIILLIVFVIATVYRLKLLDTVATAGGEYTDKYNALISLQKKNEELKNEYFTLTSIKSIRERANKLGYVNRNISYLKDEKLASSDLSN